MVSTIATLSAGTNPKEDFAASWEGHTVVLKQRLYTLAYRERGLFGNGSDKRDGLFVVTPFKGTYYQFDGRQSQDDIRAADPERLTDTIRTTYARDVMDVREYSKVEPIVITAYEPGVELIVSAVRVDRDRLRLYFTDPRTTDATTGHIVHDSMADAVLAQLLGTPGRRNHHSPIRPAARLVSDLGHSPSPEREDWGRTPV
jgi:hypothetical protein